MNPVMVNVACSEVDNNKIMNVKKILPAGL
jgi:hypothetical protein